MCFWVMSKMSGQKFNFCFVHVHYLQMKATVNPDRKPKLQSIDLIMQLLFLTMVPAAAYASIHSHGVVLTE